MAGALIIVISLLVCTRDSPKSAQFVFTDFENHTGWVNSGFVVLLGLLQSQFTLTGYDSAAHMVSESAIPLSCGSLSARSLHTEWLPVDRGNTKCAKEWPNFHYQCHTGDVNHWIGFLARHHIFHPRLRSSHPLRQHTYCPSVPGCTGQNRCHLVHVYYPRRNFLLWKLSCHFNLQIDICPESGWSSTFQRNIA